MNRFTACTLALACLASTAGAQSDRVLDPVGLQKALDRTVEFSITDAPIGEVFDRLSERTGVTFVIHEDVEELLPYGGQTHLSVTLRNVALRDALTRMLRRHALTWDADGAAVLVRPTEGLYRIGRRATYDELKLLGLIYTARLQPAEEAGRPHKQLQVLTGNEQIDLVFHADQGRRAAYEEGDRALPGTAAEWLDRACHGRDWTWYLRGEQIVIVEKSAQVERQLQEMVSLDHRHARLVDVLRELTAAARVDLTFTPGVLKMLPAETRENFNIIMADATVVDALEVIAGATGLEFTRTSEGVHVSPSEALTRGGTDDQQRRRPRYPFYIKMSLPAMDGQASVEMLLVPDELPEEVVETLKARRDEMVQRLIDDVMRQAEESR